MDVNQARQELERLRAEIAAANDAYYNQDDPLMEDFEYDALTRRLRELETQFPELADADSPFGRIGGEASALFAPVEHAVVMESLQDVFSFEELEDFDRRVCGAVEAPRYVVEPKVDGLSISLEYRDGVFVRGSTRGDGHVGEDVTANLMTIRDIPKTVKPAPAYLEVRAEVYMPKSVFAELVAAQDENGETAFKNPRNAAAGSLRQKDSSVTASRGLSIVAFNIQQIEGVELASHSQSLEYLKKLGFPVSQYHLSDGIDAVLQAVQNIGEQRHQYEFDIDGAVIKVDELAMRAQMGSTAKFPRWAAAYKYPPEIKSTRLQAVEIEVGRTGVLTPTAVFDAVQLAGTSVSRAVLHNQDFIDQKHIAIGDVINVRKAGDIIPEVLGVQESGGGEIYRIPDICPSCGTPTVRDTAGPAIRCPNEFCPARQFRSIVHFASKGAMDIDGLGPAVVKSLLEHRLVSNVSDLYALEVPALAALKKNGEKSAKNLVAAIEKSKNAGLGRVLNALGIRHVGTTAAQLLAETFGDMAAIVSAGHEQLCAIDGFGSIMAASIRDFFDDEKNLDLIERLRERGVKMTQQKSVVGDALAGKIFVLTGTLSRERSEFEKLIVQNGGKASSSVSSKTSYVVAGENAGSKLTKARELGVAVIGEEQLLQMLQGGNENG